MKSEKQLDKNVSKIVQTKSLSLVINSDQRPHSSTSSGSNPNKKSQ
jgi:hypothetical protein